MTSILFVCLGNICRSAMAEGILRQKASARGHRPIKIDSAGTSNWHIGSPPDSRAIAAAKTKNVDISRQKARQVKPADFDKFDLIIAMDEDNLHDLQAMATPEQQQKIKKCLDFSTINPGGDVPDPYYGGREGFDQVLMLLSDACDNIIDQIA